MYDHVRNALCDWNVFNRDSELVFQFCTLMLERNCATILLIAVKSCPRHIIGMSYVPEISVRLETSAFLMTG